jgi:DNA-binding beta-propeller fold protein YncE
MRSHLTVACVVACLLGCQAGAEPTDALRPAGVIPLEGVEGRIDHMAVDAENQRLYVAALGNNTVEVIDLKAGKQVGRITGLKKPQGVAFIPDLSRLVVASGDDGKCRFYDKDRKLLGTIDGLDDADNVRYDAAAKLVYVGYGEGALAVIDPDKLRKVADIKVDGHPESFQLAAKGGPIFVNVPGARHVAVIDREKRAIVAKWPMEGAQANFPMALDEEHHRLFVGCRNPAKLLVLDTETGKAVASLDCAGDTDDVFYDAANSRVYVSGGEGVVSVIEQADADHYRPLGRLATAGGARTSFFISATRSLYLAVPHRGTQRAELRVFEAQAGQH